MRRVALPLLPLLALFALVALAGCGGGSSEPAPHPADAPLTPRERADKRAEARRPPAPTCPEGTANCKTASGRVIGLESVDPDGDGDLHLILAGGSITLPGISVLDVNPRLRPKRDPKIGDWAAGAGPVYQGSYGQSQIQVERVVYWPRR
ncbi:hypothetical protein [Conexibacter woesei]|uniref:Lipoprotein n=1 Tax=Conexibacter woesei (strain DSM 14684 / CCUG 47730 / CIP 108061 / JCM 11494 / NBRC 100937 / ID131577) TaxID=469383 RepID=D3FDQ5_CONWI|nr:hypothetical protein [Conexibacter woesei]ADB49629.1 hypothetical protein Cwoe_1200 [Conexibacter woesei DSM 14684]